MKPKLRVISIAQLILDEKNANKGTKRGGELLEESLAKYGAGRSVVVDRHDRVIAGNKTVEAAVAAGMKSISVIQTDGSSLVAVQRSDLDLKKDKKARENMEKTPEGWVWKCSKHKDPSKEATVQALIKSGMIGGPTSK